MGRRRPTSYASPDAPRATSSIVRRDTTESSAAADRIEYLAYFDPLTQLPNRQRGLETALAFVRAASSEGAEVAVMCIGLSMLKRVNDTFGHAMGDVVLRGFADRLAQATSSLRLQRRID